MEIADPEASGTGSRPVLLTPVGLRPPCVSKTDLQNLERFRLFLSLTSLTNEQTIEMKRYFLAYFDKLLYDVIKW